MREFGRLGCFAQRDGFDASGGGRLGFRQARPKIDDMILLVKRPWESNMDTRGHGDSALEEFSSGKYKS